jgi:hypothetical protein
MGRSLLTAVLCVSVAIPAGCSGGDAEPQRDPAIRVQAQPGVIAINGDTVLLPGCFQKVRVPDPFKSGSAILLVQRRSPRPGGEITVAVLNDSDDPITYGQAAFLREPGSARPILGDERRFIPAVAYFAEPGRIGRCVDIPVPEAVAPGRYEAVLDQVRGVEGKELATPVRVR